MPSDASRYARQEHAFPTQRRLSTALIALNAAASPWTARSLAAGGAAMGIRLLFDWQGADASPGAHFLHEQFPDLAGAVNRDAAYGYLSPWAATEDLDLLLPRVENPWVVVSVNDPPAAKRVLKELIEAGVRYPVLLLLDAPAGIVVLRCCRPQDALTALMSLMESPKRIRPGPPEIGILAAGVALNEIMTAGGGEDLTGIRAIAYSSHHWVRRVVKHDETGPLAGLFEGIICPAGPAASFKDLRISMIGAGALGNWAALPIAAEDPRLTVCDGDGVEASNLNRQILFSRRVGQNKARALVEELRSFAPGGAYAGAERFVRRSADLVGLYSADLILCVPDNDEARLVAADAAREAGVLFGTAGSSGTGAQAVVCQPGRACYRCVTGQDRPRPTDTESASCSLAADDAVVSANMIGAGLLVNEARIALSGRRSANVRFQSTGGVSNRLGRMLTDPPCGHRSSRQDGKGAVS